MIDFRSENGSSTILVIDDNSNNIVSVSALLKNLVPDCRVIAATSGMAGLETAKQEMPDTILLDVKMPGLDGYEVCTRLKRSKTTRDIPVIMVTAIHTDSQSQLKGFTAGADAYLTKPIDEYVLAAQVKTALRVKKAEDLLRKKNTLLEWMVADKTASLQASERFLAKLLNSSPYPLITLKADTTVIFVNPAFEKLTGFAGKEIVGKKPPFPWWTEETCHNAQNDMPKAFPAGCRRIEELFQTKEGRYFWVEVSATVVVAKDGEEYYLANWVDITERRRMEAERKQLTENLRQAQKMEAIGTLAGGIAHDLNNILSSIVGYTEIAANFEIPPGNPAHESLAQVLGASERARLLVEQILTFCRKREPAMGVIQMIPIVTESIKLLRASLPATIEIQQSIAARSDTIVADATMIHQVLMNLCTNAGHAMQQAGGILEVGLTEVDMPQNVLNPPSDLAAGPYLMLSVSDTGYGMEPGVMERIFDPYFTTKPMDEGTGLGLSVVHGIVKTLKGAIDVESTPEIGSTFRVFFPKTAADSEFKETPRSEYLADGKGHILFVDDEKPIAQMGKTMLEKLGYRVTALSNSVVALAAFRSRPQDYDLVISDMTMPDLTGDRLATAVIAIRPDVPVILCTGYHQSMTTERAKALGIRKLMRKPIKLPALAAVIRQVLYG